MSKPKPLNGRTEEVIDTILCRRPRSKLHDYNRIKLETWANAQRDGRPAEYRWRPLFNAEVWLTPECRTVNAAKTRNPLKLPGVPQTNETISAASGPIHHIVGTRRGDIAA